MGAGPLSFGVSLIVQRDFTMPRRSRRMVLESLESRQLLSVSPTSAEVSALAKAKHFQVVGSLTGSTTFILSPPSTSLVATGELGSLGPVQLRGTFLYPPAAGPHVRIGFTLTSAQGTLTFTSTYSSKVGVHHGYTLKLKNRTGAYARWTGTGRLVQTTVPGPIPQPPQAETVGLSLQLTLKK